jgi:hypothetical protein
MTAPRRRAVVGWDQQIISAIRVGVVGADLAAALTIKACQLAGVSEVRWTGAPTPLAGAVANALLPDDPAVLSYPCEVTSAAELDWALGDDLHVLLVTSTNPRTQQAATQIARRRGIPAVFATTTGDRGWFASAPPPPCGPAGDDPVLALCAAGLLLDAVRELRCPRWGLLPPDGELLPKPAAVAAPHRILVVGVGGIGSWLSIVLALTPGPRSITLLDHDRVEPRNLSNQLYAADDADAAAYKAQAAQRLLQSLATADVRVLAQTERAGPGFPAKLATHRANAVASCVDNAPTRLLLQQAARQAAVPLVTGSIDVHAGDCYVQEPTGPTLDRQLRGQLTQAAATPAAPRASGCTGAYLAPGMLTAAMTAHRLLHPQANAPPMHWRAGRRPIEGPRPAVAAAHSSLPSAVSR